jgi:hypothetical protein
LRSEGEGVTNPPYVSIFSGDPRKGGIDATISLGGKPAQVTEWACSVHANGKGLTFSNANKVVIIERGSCTGCAAVTHIGIMSPTGDLICACPAPANVCASDGLDIEPGFLSFHTSIPGGK